MNNKVVDIPCGRWTAYLDVWSAKHRHKKRTENRNIPESVRASSSEPEGKGQSGEEVLSESAGDGCDRHCEQR